MNLYRYDVVYHNPDEVVPYYFYARSASEVASATGLPIDGIKLCDIQETSRMHAQGLHFDIVHNGMLTETA